MNIKFSILILALFLVLTNLNAQTAGKPIKICIDFNDNSLDFDKEELNKIKVGDFYQLYIENIHPGLYNVNLGSRDSSYTKELSFPTFATLPVKGLTDAIAGMNAIGGIVQTLNQKEVDLKMVMDSTEQNFLSDSLDFLAMQKDMFKTEFNREPTPEDLAILLLASNKEILVNKKDELLRLKIQIENLLWEIYRVTLNNQTIKDNSPFGSSRPNQEILKETIDLRNKLDELALEMRDLYHRYRIETTRKEMVEAIEANKTLNELNKKIITTFEEFPPALEAVKSPINAENGFKLLGLLVSSINQKEKTFISLPIQLTKEETELDIKITPRGETMGLFTYATKMVFPIDDKQKFWGLSSGFYVSKPANEAYSIGSSIVGADTTYRVVPEKPGNAEIGFNTMLRMGKKIPGFQSTYFQAGIGPGISISDKIRPRILVGLGLAFGGKHAVVIDVGLITGYYDALSQVYDIETDYRQAPSSVISPQLKPGGYFSLSYMFLK